MLRQRQRRWPSIKPALFQRLVFSGVTDRRLRSADQWGSPAKRDVGSILFQCWPAFHYIGTTLIQHWVNSIRWRRADSAVILKNMKMNCSYSIKIFLISEKNITCISCEIKCVHWKHINVHIDKKIIFTHKMSSTLCIIYTAVWYSSVNIHCVYMWYVYIL